MVELKIRSRAKKSLWERSLTKEAASYQPLAPIQKSPELYGIDA